ncbi:MAG: hypothetical protein ACRC1T_05275 [Clostridium chrysemydis]|uniref:hypothetical protein n=1 Tax=Clostridium chrysemydis TaxID=2665504 RepID=UPI003F30217D
MLKEKLKDKDIPKAVIDIVNKELPEGLVYKKEENFSNEFNDSIYIVSPENNTMKIDINKIGVDSYKELIKRLNVEKEIVLESKTLRINNRDFTINDLIKNPITNEEIFGEGNFILTPVETFKDTVKFSNPNSDIEFNGEFTKFGEKLVRFRGCDDRQKIFINYETQRDIVNFKIKLGKLTNIDDLVYVKDFYESNIFKTSEEMKEKKVFYFKLITLLKYLNIENINLSHEINNEDLDNIISLYKTLIEKRSVEVVFSEDITMNGNYITNISNENLTWVSQTKYNILGNEVGIRIILNLKDNDINIENNTLKIKNKKVKVNMCLI